MDISDLKTEHTVKLSDALLAALMAYEPDHVLAAPIKITLTEDGWPTQFTEVHAVSNKAELLPNRDILLKDVTVQQLHDHAKTFTVDSIRPCVTKEMLVGKVPAQNAR